MKLLITSAFGIEKMVKTELIRLGMAIESVENGAIVVTAQGDDIARLNIHLRCAERVFILLGQAKLTSFDALFDFVNSLNWPDYLTADCAFPVQAKSKKSKLFSLSDIQAIAKKAIVKRMGEYYKCSWFAERGSELPIHVNFDGDVARILIDTSGVGLHKRGYRQQANRAPLKETLAAALVLLSDWRGQHQLIDPLCGSGTIPIEAALIARHIAPGLQRKFAFEGLQQFDSARYKAIRQAAYRDIDYDVNVQIAASDIDPKAIAIARQNAENAGVDDAIDFAVSDVTALQFSDRRLTIISNPPYGERLSDWQSAERLYRAIGQKLAPLQAASCYFLTAHDGFEQAFGQAATRRRKLYNGKIKCYYYQYRQIRQKRTM